MSTAQDGSTVLVHYTGRLDDGTEFDSSRGKDPLSFTVGSGQVIPGFNNGVVGMAVGETKTFDIQPNEAYGPLHEEAVQEVPKDRFPDDFDVKVGQIITGTTNNQQPFQAKILSEQAESITLDFNHPLAGKTLTFEVELVEIS